MCIRDSLRRFPGRFRGSNSQVLLFKPFVRQKSISEIRIWPVWTIKSIKTVENFDSSFNFPRTSKEPVKISIIENLKMEHPPNFLKFSRNDHKTYYVPEFSNCVRQSKAKQSEISKNLTKSKAKWSKARRQPWHIHSHAQTSNSFYGGPQ